MMSDNIDIIFEIIFLCILNKFLISADVLPGDLLRTKISIDMSSSGYSVFDGSLLKVSTNLLDCVAQTFSMYL